MTVRRSLHARASNSMLSSRESPAERIFLADSHRVFMCADSLGVTEVRSGIGAD